MQDRSLLVRHRHPTVARPARLWGPASRFRLARLVFSRASRALLNGAFFVAVGAMAIGCGGPAPSSSLAVATESPVEIAEAQLFRETFHLRADEAWIVRVASDPASDPGEALFGVPLLPAEVDELIAHTQANVDTGAVLLAYGATVPDDWYDWYVDEPTGTVIGRFLRNLDRHRTALERLLSPSARWEVRQVDQQELEMIDLVARVKADGSWFTAMGAELQDAITIPLDGGVVEITYKANHDLDALVRDRYAAPEWLRVQRTGRLPWTGPVGDLDIKAVDGRGKPVPNLTCAFGNPPLTTDQQGLCRYNDVAAISYEIELWAEGEGPQHVAGIGTVSVKPNDTTTLTILVVNP